jgi:hypothetical protein
VHIVSLGLSVKASLAIFGGYLPDKFQTTNTKIGILGLTLTNLAAK